MEDDLPGKMKVSLRSLGSEDTTVISRRFGGGGHVNASSFNIEIDVYATWKRTL
jgi:nanoRNase/pAp phosphatase (c-di-AMP/oligoRNAs hydrolase)